jgi:hypothetical protein
VRDERHGQAAHPRPAWRSETEGEEPVRQVELLAGIRHDIVDEIHESAKDLAHRGSVAIEKLV